MASTLAERVARGLKASLVAQVVHVASNAVLLLVLARTLLTPTGYGQLQLALSVLGVAAVLGTLGVPKAAARYVTEYAEADPGQVPYVVRRSLAAVAVLGVATGVGLGLFGGRIAALVGEPALAPLLLAGVAFVVARSAFQHTRIVFQGFNRVASSSLLTALASVGRLAFAVGFVLLGLGALGALLGYVAGFVVAAAVGLVLLYRTTRRYETADEAEPGLTRKLAGYSLPLTATRGANVLDKRVDAILVGALLDATAVGYYAIAKQLADFTAVPAIALGFTISPTLGDGKAAGETERAARTYETALRHVLLLYVPGATGLVLVADPLVHHVFGDGYAPAVPVVQVFAGFVVLNAITKVTSDGLDYLGRARVRAVVKGGTAVANVGLNLLLIPRLGVVGAAVATLVTYSVYTLVNVYYVHVELSLRPGRLVRSGAGALAVAGVEAVAVLVALPYVGGLASLLGVVALGVGVWAAATLGTGLLDPRRITASLG